MVGEESSVVEAEEISRQPRNLGVESIVGVAREVSKAMYFLSMYPSEDVKDYAEEIALLISLKSYVSEEESPSTENLAMMKFLHLIIHNKELQEKLKNLDNFIRGIYGTSGFTNGKESYSRLCEVVTNFKLLNLSYKIDSLLYIKEKKDFTTLREICNVWDFYDLMTDKNFKQNIEEAVNEESEPFSEGFRKGMNDYIELAKKGENIASRHFEENIAFQAYCEEIDNASRALNVNLINYNGSEPINISDILQQEKDIGKLNIYCNKKHDICARRKDKKRYYEFKEGACYQMTSTWPIKKDESGRVVLTCTMVMDVSSEGITEITRFSGKEPNGGNYQLSPEKNKELIKKNEELYIQGSPLHEAVKKFLGMQQGREEMIRKGKSGSSLPDVVPKGNIGSDPTASGALEVHEEQPNLGKNNENMNCDTGNQSRYRTEVYLIPGTDTPQTYKTTLYVKIRNNSQIKENSHEDNINDTEKLSENSEFIECIGGLKGVVEGNIDSEHASCDNSPASTPPSTPAKYRTPGRQ